MKFLILDQNMIKFFLVLICFCFISPRFPASSLGRPLHPPYSADNRRCGMFCVVVFLLLESYTFGRGFWPSGN